ncbi:MAG: hypothetical protein GY711_11310 [bacterium]|nr:hypothetical protein [bacterium]
MVRLRYPMFADTQGQQPGLAILRSFSVDGEDRAPNHLVHGDFTLPYALFATQGASGAPVLIPLSPNTLLGRLSTGQIAGLSRTDLYALLEAIQTPAANPPDDAGRIPRLGTDGLIPNGFLPAIQQTGEANTASNQGAGGANTAEFFDQKVGLDLQFRTFRNSSPRAFALVESADEIQLFARFQDNASPANTDAWSSLKISQELANYLLYTGGQLQADFDIAAHRIMSGGVELFRYDSGQGLLYIRDRQAIIAEIVNAQAGDTLVFDGTDWRNLPGGGLDVAQLLYQGTLEIDADRLGITYDPVNATSTPIAPLTDDPRHLTSIIRGFDNALAPATGLTSGVMSAADKGKLDGIESGATGDQTAEEVRDLYHEQSVPAIAIPGGPFQRLFLASDWQGDETSPGFGIRSSQGWDFTVPTAPSAQPLLFDRVATGYLPPGALKEGGHVKVRMFGTITPTSADPCLAVRAFLGSDLLAPGADGWKLDLSTLGHSALGRFPAGTPWELELEIQSLGQYAPNTLRTRGALRVGSLIDAAGLATPYPFPLASSRQWTDSRSYTAGDLTKNLGEWFVALIDDGASTGNYEPGRGAHWPQRWRQHQIVFPIHGEHAVPLADFSTGEGLELHIDVAGARQDDTDDPINYSQTETIDIGDVRRNTNDGSGGTQRYAAIGSYVGTGGGSPTNGVKFEPGVGANWRERWYEIGDRDELLVHSVEGYWVGIAAGYEPLGI